MRAAGFEQNVHNWVAADAADFLAAVFSLKLVADADGLGDVERLRRLDWLGFLPLPDAASSRIRDMEPDARPPT